MRDIENKDCKYNQLIKRIYKWSGVMRVFDTSLDGTKYKVYNRKLPLRAGIKSSIILTYRNYFNIEIRRIL